MLRIATASTGALRRPLLHATLLFAALVAACVSNPLSGRGSYFAFGVEEDTPLGDAAFEEVLATERVVRTGPDAQMVDRVMNRLVDACQETGWDPGFQWEVVLLDSPQTVNAFCLPGGKMAVYTGILPVCQTETGLAVVMGHEIAHALARHGAERVSQEQLKGALFELGGEIKPEWKQWIEAGRLSVDVLVSLPWGRKQELEADEFGLYMMAMAGYDPSESVRFWQRMQQMTGGGGGTMVDQWLSTHPSNADRIQQLKDLLPKAEEMLPAGR
jgi:predicted Zn-dependent protease